MRSQQSCKLEFLQLLLLLEVETALIRKESNKLAKPQFCFTYSIETSQGLEIRQNHAKRHNFTKPKSNETLKTYMGGSASQPQLWLSQNIR